MTRHRLMNLSERWFTASAAALSAPTSATKWATRWSRRTWIARATR